MRKDTAILLPELETETKETLSTLIEYGNTRKDIEIIQGQRDRADKLLTSVSDEYQVISENFYKAGYAVAEIGKLTEEQVDALFKREDGTDVPFNVPTDSTRQLAEMKRDFVEMILNTEDNMKKIDESLEELYQMQKEYDEEVKNIFAEFNGDITDYTRNQLTARLETVDADSGEAKGIRKVLEAMDDALDLNGLFETYSKLDVRNTINDFFRNSHNIAEQFMRNTKTNGIAVDFSKYDFLEYFFLPEKFHKYRNLFIFLIVKKYAKTKSYTRADAIFLTQLVVNIQTLLYEDKRTPGKLTEEQVAKRERLIDGITRVMELFYVEAA